MNILVTGGTGSFGQAFVKRLLNSIDVTRIVIYSRGEHAQEEMEHRYRDDRLRFFIGDVRDLSRLELALHGIDTVVHAAALKIVPIAEYNPTECVATNVLGAQNIVKASLHTGVKRVVGLSTDKAVNPINLYGATKLAAEKIFVAANALAAGRTAFSVVRYGNVAGSRGSVVPLFKRLAAEGKPLPLTHPDMTRFWITMDQAIDLVMYAIYHSHAREILVPKIPSIKITDLIAAMSSLPSTLVGIRPGEKIHETLITADEARTTADYGKFYMINAAPDLPRVPEGFCYTSDTNTQWLTVDQLRAMT